MPPKRREKRKPDPYFEGIIAAGKERRAASIFFWPKLDYDTAYVGVRKLRFLLKSLDRTKRAISFIRWYQRKLKTEKGTRERRIAHYMELYTHRRWDLGLNQRKPLSAKEKRGIRWARQQLKAST